MEKKAVIVHSNPSVHAQLSVLLGALSVEVCSTTDLTSAASAALEPDLLFLETGMNGKLSPKTNNALGLSTTNTKVVLITPKNTEMSVALDTVPLDNVLEYPFDKNITLQRIRSWLQNQKKDQLHQKTASRLKEAHEDHRTAEKIYYNIVGKKSLSLPNIHQFSSPMEVFNGDIVLVARTPSGGINLLIGDMTGHGLSAAIGSIPAADTFYSMSAKGFGIAEIACEINSKLRYALPIGRFMAGNLISFNQTFTEASCWCGGIPDGYLLQTNHKISHALKSKHVPLGILPTQHFDKTIETIALNKGEKLIFLSDGIIEAENSEGTQFGSEQLANLLETTASDQACIPEVKKLLKKWTGNAGQTDDYSLIEVECTEARMTKNSGVQQRQENKQPPQNWKLTFQQEYQDTFSYNPVPMLLHSIIEVQGLEDHKQEIFRLLTDLFQQATDALSNSFNSTASQQPIEISLTHTIDPAGGGLLNMTVASTSIESEQLNPNNQLIFQSNVSWDHENPNLGHTKQQDLQPSN